MVVKQNEVIRMDEPNWEKIQNVLQELIDTLHAELGWFNEEELDNTARRIKDFYKEWYENSKYDRFTLFDNGGERGTAYKYDQLIVLKDITVHSMCSHHMLPFFGKAHVVYLPGEKVCGVSKLARAVRKFASKPQIQEQLTEEIADFLFEQLKPRFLMVVIEAQHTCMIIRGAREHESKMVTSAIRYDKNQFDEIIGLKDEALRLIYQR